MCVGMVPSPVLTLVGAAILISMVASAVRLTLSNAHSLSEIPVLFRAVTEAQHAPPYLSSSAHYGTPLAAKGQWASRLRPTLFPDCSQD